MTNVEDIYLEAIWESNKLVTSFWHEHVIETIKIGNNHDFKSVCIKQIRHIKATTVTDVDACQYDSFFFLQESQSVIICALECVCFFSGGVTSHGLSV